MNKLHYILFLFIFIISCAPKPLLIRKQEPFKFEKVEPYSIQDKLNDIPKVPIIEPIYVKVNLNNKTIIVVNSANEATHILLVPKEYAKILALNKSKKAYKEIVLEQEKLINYQIDTTNNFKELLQLEQQKTDYYNELYTNSENSYLREKYDRKIDNIVNKSLLYIVVIGVIAITITI